MSSDFNTYFYNKNYSIRYFYIEKYFRKHCHHLKWNPEETVLDIGSGTGDVCRKFIFPILPNDLKCYVRSDVSAKMLNEAKGVFKNNPKVSFWLLDITAEIEVKTRLKYDHIISINTFMWISDQLNAFKNVYELLKPGGGCFLMFLSKCNFVATILDLVRRPRWKSFYPNPELIYPFPYMTDPDPVRTVTDMMTTIGFSNINVYLEKTSFAFRTEDEYLGFFRAVPHSMALMTPEEQQDFQKEALGLAHNYRIINESGQTDNYSSYLVVYAEK
ncbi:hypothetical protein DMENIID0001_056660 [Sergentomyia squamirostris]